METPLLLYCVAHNPVNVSRQLSGVAGSPVKRLETNQLTAFVSETSSTNWLGTELRSAALEFHGVLQQVFRSVAIIPFRFPTVFESGSQLMEHLHEQSPQYSSLLKRLADDVQMELTLLPLNSTSAKSGTDYLREKQNLSREMGQVLSRALHLTSAQSLHWKQRSSNRGTRVYVLTRRNDIDTFKQSLAQMIVPKGLEVRVSGPWPVSEFLEEP